MMKIYPNPARSLAYVSIPDEMKKGGNMTVRNKVGEIIQECIFSENNANVIPVDLTGHPAGFYNVALADEACEISAELLNLVESDNTAVV